MYQLVQVLLDTQNWMRQMEQRMNVLVNQLGQGREDTQSSPLPRTKPKSSAHSKQGNRHIPQLEIQKKNQTASELSDDIKKIKSPKFSGFESRDAAEAWLIMMEKYFEIRSSPKTSKAVWGIYRLTWEAATWWENSKMELSLKPLILLGIKISQSLHTSGYPNPSMTKNCWNFKTLNKGTCRGRKTAKSSLKFWSTSLLVSKMETSRLGSSSWGWITNLGVP